jgi:hypothetical protein
MKSKLIFIFAFISSQAFSQTTDTLLKKYDQQFIYRYGPSFMKGGNKLSFTDLRTEFSNSPISLDLYTKAKKDKTISIVLQFVSSAMIFGILSGVYKNNSTTVYTCMGLQLVTGFASIAFKRKSITETDRAIQIRNRIILFPRAN